MATKTKTVRVPVSKKAPVVRSDGNENEVTIRHGLFRYHRNFVENDIKKTKILHAMRNETIFVNDDDYARGIEHGAFFTNASSRSKTVAEQQTRDDSAGTEPNAPTDDDLEFADCKDEQILEYMERHDADEIIVKTQGEDLALVARVLALEYMRTDGNPNPQIKDQLSDLLGSNPEEDDDGNWVNEDKKTPTLTETEVEQRAARKGAGRKATARQGGKSIGSKAN